MKTWTLCGATVITIAVVLSAVSFTFAQRTSAGRAQTGNQKNEEGKNVQPRMSEGSFNPTGQRMIVYRAGGLTLRLIKEERKLAIAIQEGPSPVATIPLPSEIVQVNDIRRVARNTAVVLGMVNGSASEVVVIDTQSHAVSDRFFAYNPSISPDGRFIAFVKFYPAHFVEGTSDYYVLYDLTHSPSANRPPNIGTADHTNVGVIVYPPNVENRDGDNTDVPAAQAHHMASQGFFWEVNSRRYVFADEHRGDLRAVMAEPGSGDAVPSAKELPIRQHEMCASLRKEDCQVSLVASDFTPTGVMLRFRGVGADAALEEILQVQYADFTPGRLIR